jgi:hypothetical protein
MLIKITSIEPRGGYCLLLRFVVPHRRGRGRLGVHQIALRAVLAALARAAHEIEHFPCQRFGQ